MIESTLDRSILVGAGVGATPDYVSRTPMWRKAHISMNNVRDFLVSVFFRVPGYPMLLSVYKAYNLSDPLEEGSPTQATL